MVPLVTMAAATVITAAGAENVRVLEWDDLMPPDWDLRAKLEEMRDEVGALLQQFFVEYLLNQRRANARSPPVAIPSGCCSSSSLANSASKPQPPRSST